jgi:predicted transcriptional regulator
MKATYKVITIKSAEDTLREAQQIMEAVMRGEDVTPRSPECSFSSFEAFRKAMTPQRFNLLKIIREKHPESIQQLAQVTGRDMKNVSEDVHILVDMGLIELEPHGRSKTPRLKYDGIRLEVAV